VPFEWVASHLDAYKLVAHIHVGDLVRVVRGREHFRQGLVTSISEHGSVLHLTDLETEETVSVIIKLMFVFLFIDSFE
jgi:transcription elongation factor